MRVDDEPKFRRAHIRQGQKCALVRRLHFKRCLLEKPALIKQSYKLSWMVPAWVASSPAQNFYGVLSWWLCVMVCYNDNLNSTHENIGPFLMSLKTIACFTSIPPRYGMIERRVKNILNQREKVDGIEIYLPLNYRRFNGERPTLPVFP